MSAADLERLQAWEMQAWRDDLDLREQAKTDPVLAALVAEADATYLAKHGKPWRNPLVRGAAK